MSHVSPLADTAAPTRQQLSNHALRRRPVACVAGSTTPDRPAPMAAIRPPVTEHPTGTAAAVGISGTGHPG